MIQESWSHPDASVIYLNETRARAESTMWEPLKAEVARAGLPYVANESKLCLRGPGNRWIWCGGGETKRHVNRWKGRLPKVAAYYLDEAQDWRDEILRHAFAEVIMPALADIGGRLTVVGVPGPLPDEEVSFWYAITRNPEFSHHGGEERPWSLWDNPHVLDAQATLDKTIRARGVTIDDPTIQREFFGRWVLDKNALVFGDLDDVLNTYAELPAPLDAIGWQFVAGSDFGFVDASALEAAGFIPRLSSKLFNVINRAWTGVGPTGTIERIDRELAPFMGRLSGLVGDPAGGGAGIMDDLNTKHGHQFEAAEKQHKVAAFKLVADIIRTREWLAPAADPETRALFRDLRRVEWDPDNRGEKLKGHTPDRVDALVYMIRKAWAMYVHQLPAPEPSFEEQQRARFEAMQLRDQIEGLEVA